MGDNVAEILVVVVDVVVVVAYVGYRVVGLLQVTISILLFETHEPSIYPTGWSYISPLQDSPYYIISVI